LIKFNIKLMFMQREILAEIRELKALMAKIIGTADLAPENQFSVEALDKAALEFEKLSIQRGDWVIDDNIEKYIKNAPWRAGRFIRENFGFRNYFMRGRKCYYSKRDLIALGKELQDRKVDLVEEI
jgi:hypothetical protein